MKPGVYEMPAAEYHADPCPEPSLSSSITRLLCDETPAHARVAHPRLNPSVTREAAEHFDLAEKKVLYTIDLPSVTREAAEHFDVGTVAHSILLEGKNAVAVLDYPDWRTNAARAARDAARIAGRIPLLRKVWSDLDAMVAATRTQLDAHVDGRYMFREGEAERVLIWQDDGGVWCRARFDWLRAAARGRAIDDYKTTSTSAHPEHLSRVLYEKGWDIQAAFYLRGLRAVCHEEGEFRFAVQETYPPYALSVLALGPDAMLLAEKKVLYAIDLWHRCLEENRWLAYPARTAYASLPPWIEETWLRKEEREMNHAL